MKPHGKENLSECTVKKFKIKLENIFKSLNVFNGLNFFFILTKTGNWEIYFLLYVRVTK